MVGTKKSSFHHGNLRQALLLASFDILDQAGPDAITIREVARRVGVSHAAPINHFKDREALLTEVAVMLFTDLKSEISKALNDDKKSVPERIKAFADGLMNYGLRNPHRYRMLWRRDLVDNKDERLTEAMDSIYHDLVEEISKASKGQSIDDDTVAIALWSMAHGYVSMRLDGNFDAMNDQVSGKTRQDAILTMLLSHLIL